MKRNLILKTDSYKLTHWDMLPDGTEKVYSYLEARPGGEHDRTLWFGLQYYLKEYLAGEVVTNEMLDEALSLHSWHFPGHPPFNAAGWMHILRQHGGRLPLQICAVPEGTIVPVGNVLMTIENTDPQVPWLTSYVESLLLKAWYPTTVATRSWAVKQHLLDAVVRTGGEAWRADYMLHDFGYRGVSSEESAQIGGGAHLVNFKGTDTIEGMRWAQHYYGAPAGVAHSVVASQHEIMTALGQTGEITQALRIITRNQNQIVSIVSDSYDYEAFVDKLIDHQSTVDTYQVHLVVRPDSVTKKHRRPVDVVLWTLGRLAERLKYTTTATGHKILKYGVLWGDGLAPSEIFEIVNAAVDAGFAAHNLVFGMGGGLLQKVNRDTERFALKCSAQFRDGQWHDVSKTSREKASKAGRLALVMGHSGFETVRADKPTYLDNYLQPVFEDGLVLKQETFETIRNRVITARWPKLGVTDVPVRAVPQEGQMQDTV